MHSQDLGAPAHRRVTCDHELIKRWAGERGAVPAVRTMRGDRMGTITLDLPGRHAPGLELLSWDRFFEAFDVHGLRFVYEDRKRDGSKSCFFRLSRFGRATGLAMASAEPRSLPDR